MGLVSTKHLGLAAFIKMHDQKLVQVENKVFTFESEKPIGFWRVEYNNSCCMRHDTMVLELREHYKTSQPHVEEQVSS